jgi:Uma2 family endonuclease
MTVRLLRDDDQPPRLTVDQYDKMIARGILAEGQPIELLDGLLVRKDRSKAGEDPMTVGREHVLVVNELTALNERIKSHGCFISIQQPIAIPPLSEPEPDAAIVRGTARDYSYSLPTASDVFCVIEVADSSLSHDRTTKQRIYAQAELAVYIIINLVDRVIEVYKDPDSASGRYAAVQTLRPGETLRLPTAANRPLDVAVDSLLP